MINKTAVDVLRGKIAELEAIRDALLPLASGQYIDPIFDKLREYYIQLRYDPFQFAESSGVALPAKLRLGTGCYGGAFSRRPSRTTSCCDCRGAG